LLLWRFEGLFPFDRTFGKPLAAGLVMIGAMLAVRTALDGLAAVGIGTVAGLSGYLLALVGLGLDPRDRLVVRELAGRYRSVLGDAIP
jgi:hypothetical protein